MSQLTKLEKLSLLPLKMILEQEYFCGDEMESLLDDIEYQTDNERILGIVKMCDNLLESNEGSRIPIILDMIKKLMWPCID